MRVQIDGQPSAVAAVLLLPILAAMMDNVSGLPHFGGQQSDYSVSLAEEGWTEGALAAMPSTPDVLAPAVSTDHDSGLSARGRALYAGVEAEVAKNIDSRPPTKETDEGMPNLSSPRYSSGSLRGLSSPTSSEHSVAHICWEARRNRKFFGAKDDDWHVTLGACRSSDLHMTDNPNLKKEVGIPACIYPSKGGTDLTMSGYVGTTSTDEGQQIEEVRASLRSRGNSQTGPTKVGPYIAKKALFGVGLGFMTAFPVIGWAGGALGIADSLGENCMQTTIWNLSREALPCWDGYKPESGVDAIREILIKVHEETYGRSPTPAELVRNDEFSLFMDEKLKLTVFPTICPYSLVHGGDHLFHRSQVMDKKDCPDIRPE